MNEEITIKRENIEAAMNAADENTKKVLEKLFGIEDKQKDTRPITERVKCFADVVDVLGDKHPYVRQLNDLLANDCGYDNHIIAYHKICMICEALNEGWRPDYHNGECRYYPWFYLYKTKEDAEKYEYSDEEIVDVPDSLRGVYWGGGANYGAYAGFAYASSNYGPSYSDAYIGSRLCLKSKELVYHAIKYFSDIWLEYLFL